MLQILKPLHDKGGALLVILTVIILAIGGSYKLLTRDLDKLEAKVDENSKIILERTQLLHDLDKRILILEIHDRDNK